ncbi:MAG TPA: SGNH/GDSL hydrolase family protein [Candidatus Limadaptatus stercoravium]|nr:SGNH/GDSL hydrolase family protein [Candidatus Limadaptatus stercoravium]
MKKKIIASVLCVVLLACCAAALAACNNDGETAEKTEIVYLGDSIAEGILGASPLGLRHEYAYANVLGRRNDFEYYNHSVSGHLTKDLLALLNNDLGYDGARGLILHVQEADIIHVSILGNDLLQDMSMNDVVLEAAQGLYTIIDGIAETAYENITGIVARIRELNPDATLIFQNVYNPLSEKSTLVDEETRATLKEEYDTYPEDFRQLGAGILDRLNGVLDRYLAEHPGAFIIADAQAEFDRIFAEDYERGKDLIYPDYIHPSNEGHAVLADLTQGILEEQGLANASAALAEYKTMRKNMLDNYFDGIVTDIDGVKAAIDAAADCPAVTEAFFDATRGLTPDYSEINYDYAAQSTTSTSSDMSFAVNWNASSLMGVSLGGESGSDSGSDSGDILGMLLGIAGDLFDRNKTGVSLGADGTMRLSLVLDPEMAEGLAMFLPALGGLDMGSFADTYLEPIMPGFTSMDIIEVFGLAEESLGLKVVSDGDTDAFLRLLAGALFDGGQLPEDIAIPEGFGLVLESTYTLRTVTYPDGTAYTGVFLTPSDPDTQSYIVMTMYDYSDGTHALNLKVDFVKLDLWLYERA